jgi:hypothetical protein
MRRFAFDTVFDQAGAVASTPAPPKKKHFTADEVDEARAAGRAEGERSAVARAEAAQAAALREIAQAVTGALGALAAVAHDQARRA